MNPEREDVLAMVRRLFPEAEVSAVMVILDRYGADLAEPERARVQLAILKLSEGQTSRLRHYLEAAKRDYRDVLHWVENPAQLPAVLEVLRTKWSWALLYKAWIHGRCSNRFGNIPVHHMDWIIRSVTPVRCSSLPSG